MEEGSNGDIFFPKEKHGSFLRGDEPSRDALSRGGTGDGASDDASLGLGSSIHHLLGKFIGRDGLGRTIGGSSKVRVTHVREDLTGLCSDGSQRLLVEEGVIGLLNDSVRIVISSIVIRAITASEIEHDIGVEITITIRLVVLVALASFLDHVGEVTVTANLFTFFIHLFDLVDLLTGKVNTILAPMNNVCGFVDGVIKVGNVDGRPLVSDHATNAVLDKAT